MAFQRVASTVKVDLVYGYGTGPDIINSVYFRNTTLVGAARNEAYLSDLADAVAAWWDGSVKGLQTSGIALREVRCTDLDSEFAARFIKSVGTSGTGSASAAPSAASALVRLLGDFGSAPRRGQLFHPGLTEAQIAIDGIDGTFAGTLEAAYDDLRTVNGDPADALVIVSRYSGFTIVDAVDENHTSRKVPTKRNPALTNTIAGVVVPTRYGVQKRRRPSPL